MSRHHVFREYYEPSWWRDLHALRAHLRGAGVQDPHRLDGGQPPGRRPPLRQQVHLRAALEHPAAPAPPVPRHTARRRRRVQVPAGPRAGLHQARGWPSAGDTVEVQGKQLVVDGIPEVNPLAMYKDPQVIPDSPALPPSVRNRDHFGPFRVPNGFVFCMATTGTTRTTPASGVRPAQLLQGRAGDHLLVVRGAAQLARVARVVGPAWQQLASVGVPLLHPHALGALVRAVVHH